MINVEHLSKRYGDVTVLKDISAEIRTPLNGVIGMLELMRADARVGELRPELDLAYFSARSLLDILNDVLDFSKIEAGRLEVELPA